MSNVKFFIHLFVLLLLQFAILDNIRLNSYVYINIYILAIYILPYRWSNLAGLFLGFFIGLAVDVNNDTMGIHTAATTLLAYLRPYLLQAASNRDPIDDVHGQQKIGDTGWFFKYVCINTLIFNGVLMFCETFTFRQPGITLLRIGGSTLMSVVFILLYYFIALKKKQE